MTRAEAEEIMQSPEYSDREAVYAYEGGDSYVVEKNGHKFRAENIWDLDTKLDGAFGKRNIFLVSKEEASNE